MAVFVKYQHILQKQIIQSFRCGLHSAKLQQYSKKTQNAASRTRRSSSPTSSSPSQSAQSTTPPKVPHPPISDQQPSSPLSPNPISIILNFLLTIYIGLITSSTLRQTITLFINQREQGNRQYQYVMGLCKKVHTLSNLFYMMVFCSVFLFPFYVVVNLYGFKIVYVWNFGCFVIASNLLAIALVCFFKEHKVAAEVIGIVFSLASFLPLVYKPDQYGLKHYLARIMPNSAFTLAIQSNDSYQSFKISLTSLFFCKFYLLIFYTVEFRQDFLENFKNCMKKCKKVCNFGSRGDSEMLMSQIQVQSSSGDHIASSVPTIQLKNVEKRFGKVIAVDKISLKIYKSQILGLLGRNGAGKTTLVDMITKITRPNSGTIKFFKQKPQNSPQSTNSQKINIGICYQHEILYEDLTVLDHLKFYSQLKGVKNIRQQIDHIVDKVGIRDQISKKVKELSGGNKRKLSFCIALLNSPDVLIFDQPTSGLDPLSRRNIWGILEHLRSAQTTIILTTHHLDQADHLSDRICVVKKGKIIQQGTPKQIKQKHGKGYYLTLYYNPLTPSSIPSSLSSLPSQKPVPFDTKLYTKILTQSLKHIRITDRSSQYIKYFIQQNVQYKNLIKCIQVLERLDGIVIGLQANNLEQSFIALNMDIDVEGGVDEGEAQRNGEERGRIGQPRQHPSPGFFRQVYGVFLKNLYCYIHKFHYFYNLNLIILLFVTLINSLLISKLTKSDSITQQQAQSQSQTNPIFILQGYIFMSSAFLSIPVLQKQQKIIQLLRTRGVTKVSYWFGHFLFDFSYFWINFIIVWVFFSNVVKDVEMWIIAITAVAMIFYSYTVSMVFNKVKTANNWFTVVNSLLMLITLPLMAPEQLFKDSFYRYLSPFRYIYPFYDLTYSLLKNQQIFKALIALSENSTQQTPQYYYSYYCLPIYFLVFFLLQSSLLQKLIKPQPSQSIPQNIKLDNISKKYNKTQALRNVNYTINQQRVALLGHNGAGKSTTFGLLSGQLNPSQGKVYLQHQYKKKYDDVMGSTGICYQEDTLWKFMTPGMICKIFSCFVGIFDWEKQMQWLFDNLDIESQLKNRKFQNLSGGNKRKICMAVCVMGSPNTKLLDQCSTGLDPVSRLSMVNTLKLQNNGSIIFTTHSIPQAQQICSRAIIMKKGQVSQDAKIYKLKQKYYDCYWVQIIDHQDHQRQVQQQYKQGQGQIEKEDLTLKNKQLEGIVMKVLPKLQNRSYKINSKKNRIQIPKNQIKLSTLMYQFWTAKANKIIRDFNINQPQLQDVYLLLTADEQLAYEVAPGQEIQMMEI